MKDYDTDDGVSLDEDVEAMQKQWAAYIKNAPPQPQLSEEERLERPGVSVATLKKYGVRFIKMEEAKGFNLHVAEGLLIPYFDHQPPAVTLPDNAEFGTGPCFKRLPDETGRGFCRVRREIVAGNLSRYTQPPRSGAQLYLPSNEIASDLLVITEGEFKALSLVEAGIPAAGIGGIQSCSGRALEMLLEHIARKKIKTVAFLGDADTALIHPFAVASVKMRKALPDGVRLILPRMTLGGPKGIDDLREADMDGFPATWANMMAGAVEVSATITPDALALKLLLPALGTIFDDYDNHEGKLLKFACCLRPDRLEELAKLVAERRGVSAAAFKRAVKEAQRDAAKARRETPAGRAEFYYLPDGKYVLVEGGRYIPLVSDAALARQLVHYGTDRDDVDEEICRIQTANFAAYSGHMPGWKAGIYPTEHGPFLITSSPKIIEAKRGEWPLIGRIFNDLFRSEGQPDQLPAVLSWLKVARENVKAGTRRPLPALAMVGPRGGGKTLALEIFQLTLGGRSVPAYNALISETGFNAALLDAELLIIDDPKASKDHRARARFGQSIKETLFGGSVSVTRKHRESIPVRPVHALAMALNSEVENVMVLPPIDDHLMDKLSLILTGKANLTDEETEDRERFMGRIVAEMPAFLHDLEAFEIPAHLRNQRTKAAAWMHPEILAILNTLAPETQLMELLSQVPEFNRKDRPWAGTASEAQRVLMENPNTYGGARLLLGGWAQACGTYLSRLAASGKGIKKTTQGKGVVRYEIEL